MPDSNRHILQAIERVCNILADYAMIVKNMKMYIFVYLSHVPMCNAKVAQVWLV